jgi:hypothetical protein
MTTDQPTIEELEETMSSAVTAEAEELGIPAHLLDGPTSAEGFEAWRNANLPIPPIPAGVEAATPEGTVTFTCNECGEVLLEREVTRGPFGVEIGFDVSIPIDHVCEPDAVTSGKSGTLTGAGDETVRLARLRAVARRDEQPGLRAG